MWVWRDDTGRGRGIGAAGDGGAGPGWRLDASGTWTWDEPSLLERSGVGVGALRREPVGAVPAARVAEPGLAATPIFRALAEDRSRRSRVPAAPDAGYDPEPSRRTASPAPLVPEPHPGSGPLPIQDPAGRARRGLAEVPTVPPPPGPGDDVVTESPEDELRRRAERRRRPRTEPEGREDPAGAGNGGGRHALREARPVGGRHAML